MNAPRVLVVDDDIVNLSILVKILTNKGIETVPAHDGREAMTILQADPGGFDVILLDRMMPRMDGMEVLRQVKSTPMLKALPVIMQTAMGDIKEIMEGLNAGAFYYLTKPLNHKLVVAVVRTAAEDHARWAVLRAEVEGSHLALRLMDQGHFRFQTLEQCNDLTKLLAKSCPGSDRIVMGLSELMLNALEHGNLGISYQDKTALIHAQEWHAEVSRRQQLPENHDKWVEVTFQRSEERIRFEILDQGPGFNWRNFITPSPDRVFDNHGRGILLAKMQTFDRIEYQGAGNQVVAEMRTTA
jgi:DNA-binding response OmpR family regulator